LTHTFLVLVTAGLGHVVYRKLYTLIGGQRAEKFENHWHRVFLSVVCLRGVERDTCLGPPLKVLHA